MATNHWDILGHYITDLVRRAEHLSEMTGMSLSWEELDSLKVYRSEGSAWDYIAWDIMVFAQALG